MEYTNRHNLAPEIVKALTKDRYNPDAEPLGDYSATKICNPIQQTILKQRYAKELKQQDVIDNFWAFIGSIAHKVLEEHGTDGSLIEKRFYMDIQGKTLSGQVDHYKDGVITDYKSTKVYKIMKGDFSDWEEQLNVYALLARENGYKVKQLRIFTFLLDWKKHEVFKANYPQCPVVEIPLKLWEVESRERFVSRRIELLTKYSNNEDNSLLWCTPKEMWQDFQDYAILKGESTRAKRCFDTEDKAKEYLNSLDASKRCGDERIVKRMTKRTRCFEYCPVNHKCFQHKKLCVEEGVGIEENTLENGIF